MFLQRNVCGFRRIDRSMVAAVGSFRPAVRGFHSFISQPSSRLVSTPGKSANNRAATFPSRLIPSNPPLPLSSSSSVVYRSGDEHSSISSTGFPLFISTLHKKEREKASRRGLEFLRLRKDQPLCSSPMNINYECSIRVIAGASVALFRLVWSGDLHNRREP